MISPKDHQVQEIIQRADESVANDPDGQPLNLTITEYAAQVFAAIEEKLGKNIK